MSMPVRNTGAIEFPLVAWGDYISLYFLFFLSFPTMLVVVNVFDLVGG